MALNLLAKVCLVTLLYNASTIISSASWYGANIVSFSGHEAKEVENRTVKDAVSSCDSLQCTSLYLTLDLL